LVALNAKTGKPVWSVKNGDAKLGAVNTNAPHIFKDKVITGIRDMQRLTSGKSNYFRSRIRKALSLNASERNIKLYFKGQTVEGLEFEIIPFADDPLRSRFEQWADKHYVFTVSSHVPGAVVAIRSWVKSPTEMKTVWQESLLLEGATL